MAWLECGQGEAKRVTRHARVGHDGARAQDETCIGTCHFGNCGTHFSEAFGCEKGWIKDDQVEGVH